MKISFSISPISAPEYCISVEEGIETLKECDLVFSVNGTKLHNQEKAKEILGDKYIPLKHNNSSSRIIRYIKTKEYSYPSENRINNVFA